MASFNQQAALLQATKLQIQEQDFLNCRLKLRAIDMACKVELKNIKFYKEYITVQKLQQNGVESLILLLLILSIAACLHCSCASHIHPDHF